MLFLPMKAIPSWLNNSLIFHLYDYEIIPYISPIIWDGEIIKSEKPGGTKGHGEKKHPFL